MIFLEKPTDFFSVVDASGCAIEHQGRHLWLLRGPTCRRPLTWGFPGGKLEPGETPRDAIVREIQEETGLVRDPSEYVFLKTFYVRWPEADFAYHVFLLSCDELPITTLEAHKHLEHRWFTPREARELEIIQDGGFVLQNLFDTHLLCAAS